MIAIKRHLKIFLLVLFFFFASAKIVRAYDSDKNLPAGLVTGVPPQVQRFEDNTRGNDAYNSDSSVNENYKSLIISINESLMGPMDPQYQTAANKGGAIASVGRLVAGICANPPASSVTYFADVLHNLGITKQAYAQQGVGFSGMRNLLSLWKASRNLAYIFSVIAFLYIGIAIMFRLKIDPKTTISIQNALPKLVVALILVTFSYAIVGLMIDLIYLLINIGVLTVGQTGLLGGPDQIVAEQARYANMTFGRGIAQIFTNLIANPIVEGGLVLGFIGSAISLFFITLFTSGALSLLIGGAGVIIILLLAIVILIQIFKLFFALVLCYIQIIISLITAPIQIMMGAIPGSQMNFNSWFKNLLANILVFPAVVLFILLSNVLVQSAGPTWAPPLTAGGGAIPTLLGLGMIFLIAQIPDMVKAAFKIKPSGYGSAIMETFKPGIQAGQAIVGRYKEKDKGEIQKRAEAEAQYKDWVDMYRKNKSSEIK